MRKKQYILLICLWFLSINIGFAQEQLGLREKANQYYISYQYANAAKIYLKLANSKKPKLGDLERLADCYERINEYQAAENWYAKVVQYPESKTENLLKYGIVLKSNAHYAEAKKILQQYLDKAGNHKNISNEIAGCDSALRWIAKPTRHQITNQSLINSPVAEFGVFIHQDKTYFVSEKDSTEKRTDGRTGNAFLSIFTANRASDNTLSNAVIDPSVYNKGRLHIGPIAVNRTGNVFYVTKTYDGKKGEETKVGKTKFRTSNLELEIYTLKDGKWSLTPFAYNNIKKYSVGHAALSPDEKTLYFISDMEGGLGGTDIWYCELQTDGSWGKPQNAGAKINSSEDELFPNIDNDGTIYYASNGWPGMGGLDIFSAKGNKNLWSSPTNLGYPVNSAGDDFAFLNSSQSAQSISGYLSSNRKGGQGNDDIYSFSYTKPKLILVLKGTVSNKKTAELLSNATVSLFANGQKLLAKPSKADGSFIFELDKETDYKVLGQKEKFHPDSATISTKGLVNSDTLVVALKLDPMFEVGKIIALKNIHYDFDKDNIRKDAAKILDGLVKTMQDNPTLEIELGSHTDSRGPDIYNLDLSQRRARSAVNYLVSHGIARSRMTAKGYGETQLLNRCANGVKCTAEEHQQNRRTEFKILKY